MRVPRGKYERWKCRTQWRPAALVTMCHRASSLARSFVRSFVRSCRVSFFLSYLLYTLLFSSLGAHPSFFSLFPISFLDVLVSPNAACCACVRACVREPKFAQRGYGYITRTETLRAVANTQLRGNVASRHDRFRGYVIAAVASRQIPCMHIHQYIRRNTCTYGKRTVHTSTYPNTHWRICSCTRTDIKVYVPGPARRSLGVRFSSHVHAKPRQRQNGERASERVSERASGRADERASQPRWRGTDAPCLRIHRSFSSSRFYQPVPLFPTTEVWQYKPSNITAGRAVR